MDRASNLLCLYPIVDEIGTSDSKNAGFVGLELANWSDKETQVKWHFLATYRAVEKAAILQGNTRI